MKNKIVIVGASGAVGSKIALHLAKDQQLVLAGRNKNRLQNIANKTKRNTSILVTDINNTTDFSFLETAQSLIMCVDIENTSIVDACIEHGVDYVDISASKSVLEILQSRDQASKIKGVKILFGLGLAPGLSNILAQELIRKMPSTTSIQLFILLGLGEAHGEQAYQWTFDNLHKNYKIKENNNEVSVRSFTNGVATNLIGKRTFYLFDFVDQHFLKSNHKVATIQSRLAFDNKAFTKLIAWMRAIGLTKIYKNKSVQKWMTPLMKKFKLGSDVYGIKVLAQDKSGRQLSAHVHGFNEGAITALVAAKAIPYLQKTEVNGLIFAHDIIDNTVSFLQELKAIEPSFNYDLESK